MIKYGFAAVIDSRKQMDDRTALYKPYVGRIALALMRTGMRIVNALPPIKKRMAEAQSRYRGFEREDDELIG
ncbi:hypothetical protein [Gordoniibacillus kamchatkensis]|uniref:hypothetical protein n=1 Tax=Gordoniibacillus kamchatkensis TaxID=1590651 RepID=UPI000AA652C1|nr:hypothetical protein [Paenibacillus sp. VKM B-2647]